MYVIYLIVIIFSLSISQTRRATHIVTVLPEKLWSKPWVSPPPLDAFSSFSMHERSSQVFEIVSMQYQQHFGVQCPGFSVRGTNPKEIMERFKSNILKDAIESGEWSKVLSPNRHFTGYVYIPRFFFTNLVT